MNRLTKIFLTVCMGLMLNATAFAYEEETTILIQNMKIGNVNAELPYIDGMEDIGLEKMANDLILKKAKEMVKKLGNNGEVNHGILLNRPTLVTMILRGTNGEEHFWDGVNIDLTTGKEFTVTDFFVNNDEIKKIFGKNPDVMFDGNTVAHRPEGELVHHHFVPYTDILQHARIGEIGRIFPVTRLSKNADGKKVYLKSENLFTMNLDSNPSSGYTWIFKENDQISGKVIKVGNSFVMPAAGDTRVGTPGKEIIMFAALEVGSYDFVLEYKRPWETMVAESVRFKLIVQ